MGVKKYIAIDVNNLIKSTPVNLYEKLFVILKKKYPSCDVGLLREQFKKSFKDVKDKIMYIVDKNFEIKKITNQVDIVVSHAAFEHFENIERTFREIKSVVRETGVLVAYVDLKTHTRWIRDRDPLNVYRYSDFFWNLFNFKGSLNRVRSSEYKKLFEKIGWFNIEIVPVSVLEEGYLEKVKPLLNKKFKKMDSSEMKIISFILMAKK
jgi:SAM-dependent methyltransferase